MGIDLNKYTYTEIEGLPNVLWEEAKGRIASTEPRVLDGYIGPGIRRIALSRPEWTLIGNRATARHEVTRFDVWDGTERMGGIEREYRNSGYCYGISNSRIAAKLQRGSVRYTKDMTKALKMVYATFSPKSHGEAMTTARAAIGSAIGGRRNARRYDWHRIRDSYATEQVNAFLLNRWDEFMAFLGTTNIEPKPLTECEKGPELYEAWQELAAADHQLTEGLGTLVLLRGGKYATYRKATSDHVVLVDNLRPDLKIGLGMLKLSPDETFIPGVGYRLNATTYFLMDPETAL